MQKKGNNKIQLLFVLMFLTFSCKNNFSSKTAKLSANNKLWQIDRPSENIRGAFTYYRFSKDGEWIVYKKNKGSKVFERPNMGDIELLEIWKLIDDSTINVGGLNYKILTLNDTALIYMNSMNSEIKKMVFKGDKLP